MGKVTFEGSLYWHSVLSLVQLIIFINDLAEELASLWKAELDGMMNMSANSIHISKSSVYRLN